MPNIDVNTYFFTAPLDMRVRVRVSALISGFAFAGYSSTWYIQSFFNSANVPFGQIQKNVGGSTPNWAVDDEILAEIDLLAGTEIGVGLIKATIGAVGGTRADQWRDFLTVPAGIQPTDDVFRCVTPGHHQPSEHEARPCQRGEQERGQARRRLARLGLLDLLQVLHVDGSCSHGLSAVS